MLFRSGRLYVRRRGEWVLLPGATGTVTVTITGTDNGAWYLDGSNVAHASGDTVTADAGPHTVSFRTVPGMTAPETQTVTIPRDGTAAVSAAYTEITAKIHYGYVNDGTTYAVSQLTASMLELNTVTESNVGPLTASIHAPAGSVLFALVPAAAGLTVVKTPCVFLKHWKAYKHDIARMIQARQVAGIQNTSTTTLLQTSSSCYAVTTNGGKGKLVVWLGDQKDAASKVEGCTKILEGKNYSYWIENSLVAAWQAIPAPTFKEDTVKKHDITIHLKDPGWPQVYFYAWDGNLYINDEWPGVKVTATKNIGGVKYYYRTFNVSAEAGYSMNVIFDQGSSDAQTVDITGITSDRYYEIASSTNKFEVRDITSEVTGQ